MMRSMSGGATALYVGAMGIPEWAEVASYLHMYPPVDRVRGSESGPYIKLFRAVEGVRWARTVCGGRADTLCASQPRYRCNCRRRLPKERRIFVYRCRCGVTSTSVHRSVSDAINANCRNSAVPDRSVARVIGSTDCMAPSPWPSCAATLAFHHPRRTRSLPPRFRVTSVDCLAT